MPCIGIAWFLRSSCPTGVRFVGARTHTSGSDSRQWHRPFGDVFDDHVGGHKIAKNVGEFFADLGVLCSAFVDQSDRFVFH